MEEKNQEEIQKASPSSQQSEPIETNVEGTMTKLISKKSTIIFAAIVLVLIAIGVIGFNVYNSPLNKLKRALTNESLFEAENIYFKYSMGENFSARQAVVDFSNEKVEQFNTGEKDYNSVYEMLIYIQSNFEHMESLSQLDSLAEIKRSKESFAQAEQAEQSNDIFTAILLYDSISMDSKLYRTADSKVKKLKEIYKAEIIEKANALAEKGKYREAADLLGNSLEALTGDSDIVSLRDDNQAKADEADISKALSDAKASADEKDYVGAIDILEACSMTNSRITEKITEYQNLAVATLLEEAENSVKEGDYSSAIFTLETCYLKSEKIEEKLAEITKAYEEKVLADAEALAKEGRYEDAVSTINLATATLGEERDIFAQKIEEYKAKYPVSLLDLTYTQKDETVKLFSNDVYEDIYGNSGTTGISFYGNYTEKIEFVLNGKYKKLQSKIICSKDLSPSTIGAFEIYVDDTLKFSQKDLSQKTEPITFEIDISNAKFIKIVASKIADHSTWRQFEAAMIDPICLS